MLNHARVSQAIRPASGLQRRASSRRPRLHAPQRLSRAACACGGTCPHCVGNAAATLQPHARAPRDVLQRKPGETKQTDGRPEQELKELAGDPNQAHQAWKDLGLSEQMYVLEWMEQRYGRSFAQQFREEAKKGKSQATLYYYQPGSGPKPEQLAARGYRVKGRENTGNAAFDIEVWVHPSGSTVRRDISTYKFGKAEPEQPGETKETEASKAKKPPRVEPPPPDRTGEALELLRELERLNKELEGLCLSEPPTLKQSDRAEDAPMEWTFARDKLKEFRSVDMRAVYPDFWKAVDEAAAHNVDVRKECCKIDPSNYFLSCDDFKSDQP